MRAGHRRRVTQLVEFRAAGRGRIERGLRFRLSGRLRRRHRPRLAGRGDDGRRHVRRIGARTAGTRSPRAARRVRLRRRAAGHHRQRDTGLRAAQGDPSRPLVARVRCRTPRFRLAGRVWSAAGAVIRRLFAVVLAAVAHPRDRVVCPVSVAAVRLGRLALVEAAPTLGALVTGAAIGRRGCGPSLARRCAGLAAWFDRRLGLPAACGVGVVGRPRVR